MKLSDFLYEVGLKIGATCMEVAIIDIEDINDPIDPEELGNYKVAIAVDKNGRFDVRRNRVTSYMGPLEP